MFSSEATEPVTRSDLRLLSTLISSSIETIESRMSAQGHSFPSLDVPFDPSSKAELTLLEADVQHATEIIIAAASQLIRMVRHPTTTVVNDTVSVSTRLPVLRGMVCLLSIVL